MRRLAAWGIVVLQIAALGAWGAPPALGAEYELNTQARYDVRPDDGLILVSVTATLTNTTPDPDGQFSVFSELKLAIHDDAASVSATDADGDLDVSVARERGVNVATVALRTDLRFEESAEITLRYRLADTETAQLRVRPSVVVFPAWGFGTASRVTVRIPPDYEIRVDGDDLSAENADGATVLTSGRIANPAAWLALVTATSPTTFTTYSASVPLDGGTADLQVQAFADDAAWGERTRDLLQHALPRMERLIAQPYPHVGPLVVTEAVVGGSGDFAESDTEPQVQLAYDAPPFTALHQIAHVWLRPEIIGDRWIREGLASHVAADVGAELGVEPPYDPAAETEHRAAEAFPLAQWAADTNIARADYAFAASWALIDQIASETGPDVLWTVLQRVAGGVGPYDPVGAESPEPSATTPEPLVTRAFLDQLETVGEAALAEQFGALVLATEDAALLPAREEARSAFDELRTSAEPWDVPQPIVGAMESWSFDAAHDLIADADEWIALRDDLRSRMSAVGLALPTRLHDAFRAHGGGPEAVQEIAAERAVVDAYTLSLNGANGPRSLLERIGLLGGPTPEARLSDANSMFADGDLVEAAAAIADADRLVATAEMGGALRLASLGIAVLVALALIVLLLRRRRSAASR
jgi:hypothetical protein